MTDLAAWCRAIILLGCCLLWGGCFSDSDAPVDEQKDPHFLAGRSRVNGMDFRGAVESFEKALEANPRSASAHFELGWLLEEKEPKDFAGAIYHYEHFLKLRPTDDKAEKLRQRIVNCKQELARTVSLGPVNQETQRRIDKLIEENLLLKKQAEMLTAQLAQAAQRPVPTVKTNNAVIVAPSTPPTTNRLISAQKSPTTPSGGNKTSTVSGGTAPSASQTHTVKSGDTPASIARKYGVALTAVMSANPGLDPKKLRIGQVITVPAK